MPPGDMLRKLLQLVREGSDPIIGMKWMNTDWIYGVLIRDGKLENLYHCGVTELLGELSNFGVASESGKVFLVEHKYDMETGGFRKTVREIQRFEWIDSEI